MSEKSQEIVRKLKASESMMKDCHDDAWKDLAFAAGNQFDADRKPQGRTNEVFNRIVGLVNPIVNAIKQAPPSIKINPLGPGAQTAWAKHVASRIRMLEQQCHANRARLHALRSAVICGIGWWRTVPRDVAGVVRPMTETVVDPTNIFPDAMSREPDFSDARHIFHKTKGSRKALVRLGKGSEWEQANLYAADQEDELVDTVEFWSIESGVLERVILCNDLIVHEQRFETEDKASFLTKLPYSFVHGDFYQEEKDGSRRYAGVTRYARADQVLINYTRNEIISEIEGSPKADYIAEEDAAEGFETEWANSNKIRRAMLFVKSLAKIKPIERDRQKVPEYSSIAMQAQQSMVEIVGVGPAPQQVLENVSGKSARLQISQSSVQNYQYADSHNMAVEHDGDVYLDQVLYYERDGLARPVLGDDGRTVTHVVFAPEGTQAPQGVEVVDVRPGQFGVAVSTGPSYGSQIEQLQDYALELMKIPAAAPVVPIIMANVLRQIPIPGSEDMADAVMMTLPPIVQQAMAGKGDKSAALAQALAQAQQAGQQVQAMAQQVQQLSQALQQSQSALATRGAIQDRDNAAKIEIERIRAANAEILKRLEIEGQSQLAYEKAGHQIITDFAKTSPLPVAPLSAPMQLAQESLPGGLF